MIEKLVRVLPEVYQPVFGYPHLSSTASRPCLDRLQQIEQIYSSLEGLLNRPLKVLDLGCAQGFFSLSLAQRGAEVHGVDYLDKNIDLCRALANEHSILKISFEERKIEDLLPTLQSGQYDLVLGLSVFHHLIYIHGVSYIKTILEQLAEISGALILEFAINSEPLYWGPSQPPDPCELIHNIGFIHLIAHHGTHLAEIPRPLFIASNKYWILGDLSSNFDKWSFESHVHSNGTHKKSRRYFFSRDFIVKQYYLDGPRGNHNKLEFEKEIKILSNPPIGFNIAKLIFHLQSETEAYVVMERLPGILLIDLIQSGRPYDSHQIILSLLEQLIALEDLSLYHNDVRSWNILLDEVNLTACLIDYGSICSKKQDCVWPGNLFLSFFILLKEVISGNIENHIPIRSTNISPLGLPEPFRSWALTFWKQSTDDWSFKNLYQSLLNGQKNDYLSIFKQNNNNEPLYLWMQAMEEAVQRSSHHYLQIAFETNKIVQQAQEQAMIAKGIAKQLEDQIQFIFSRKLWRISFKLMLLINKINLGIKNSSRNKFGLKFLLSKIFQIVLKK